MESIIQNVNFQDIQYQGIIQDLETILNDLFGFYIDNKENNEKKLNEIELTPHPAFENQVKILKSNLERDDKILEILKTFYFYIVDYRNVEAPDSEMIQPEKYESLLDIIDMHLTIRNDILHNKKALIINEWENDFDCYDLSEVLIQADFKVKNYK